MDLRPALNAGGFLFVFVFIFVLLFSGAFPTQVLEFPLQRKYLSLIGCLQLFQAVVILLVNGLHLHELLLLVVLQGQLYPVLDAPALLGLFGFQIFQGLLDGPLLGFHPFHSFFFI